MKITKFIVYGPIMNRYHLFVDGQYYAAKLRNQSELDIEDDSKAICTEMCPAFKTGGSKGDPLSREKRKPQTFPHH